MNGRRQAVVDSWAATMFVMDGMGQPGVLPRSRPRRIVGRRLAAGTDARPWWVPVAHLHWQSEGACIGSDPEAFFRDGRRADPTAMRLCEQCPVLDTCRQYALDHSELAGCWGGTTKRERDQIRRTAS